MGFELSDSAVLNSVETCEQKVKVAEGGVNAHNMTTLLDKVSGAVERPSYS